MLIIVLLRHYLALLHRPSQASESQDQSTIRSSNPVIKTSAPPSRDRRTTTKNKPPPPNASHGPASRPLGPRPPASLDPAPDLGALHVPPRTVRAHPGRDQHADRARGAGQPADHERCTMGSPVRTQPAAGAAVRARGDHGLVALYRAARG